MTIAKFGTKMFYFGGVSTQNTFLPFHTVILNHSKSSKIPVAFYKRRKVSGMIAIPLTQRGLKTLSYNNYNSS